MSASNETSCSPLFSRTKESKLLASGPSSSVAADADANGAAIEKPIPRGTSICNRPPSSLNSKSNPNKTYQKYVDHSYTDYASVDEDDLRLMKDTTSQSSDVVSGTKETKMLLGMSCSYGPMKSKGYSGSVMLPFPGKLLEVLDRGDLAPIIDWMPHGRAFIVKRPEVFASQILPRFFKQTKFLSFTRQLNLWGMKRITRGLDTGAYYHELFLPGRPNLAMRMKRLKTKGTGIRPMPNPEAEPNFYHDYPTVERRPKTHLMPLPPLPSERMASLHQHSASHRFMPPMTSSMAAGQSFMSRMTASDSSIGASHQALSTPSFMPPMTASASSMGSQSFIPSTTASGSNGGHGVLPPMAGHSSTRVALNMADPGVMSGFQEKNGMGATSSIELRQGLVNQRSLSKAPFPPPLDDVRKSNNHALHCSNKVPFTEPSSASSQNSGFSGNLEPRSLYLRQRVTSPSIPLASRGFDPSGGDAHDEISFANRRLIERLQDWTASNAPAQHRPLTGDVSSANSLLDRTANIGLPSAPGRSFASAQRRSSFRDLPPGGGPIRRPLGGGPLGRRTPQLTPLRTSLKASEPFDTYSSHLPGIRSQSLHATASALPTRARHDINLGLPTGSRQDVNVETVAKALREAQQLEEIAKSQSATAQALARALHQQQRQELTEYDALKYL